jgi:hypothetical protein
MPEQRTKPGSGGLPGALLLAALLSACAESPPPIWTQGTLAVSPEIETGPVETAAEFWNGYGAQWTVARSCDRASQCVLTAPGPCYEDHNLACAEWDGSHWLVKVTQRGFQCFEDCGMDPGLTFAHELGHVMGFQHRNSGVMTARIEDASWE